MGYRNRNSDENHGRKGPGRIEGPSREAQLRALVQAIRADLLRRGVASSLEGEQGAVLLQVREDDGLYLLVRLRPAPRAKLSPQEARIARLLPEAKSNKEIASALNVSRSTVETHLHRRFIKLGVNSRSTVACFAQLFLGHQASEDGREKRREEKRREEKKRKEKTRRLLPARLAVEAVLDGSLEPTECLPI